MAQHSPVVCSGAARNRRARNFAPMMKASGEVRQGVKIGCLGEVALRNGGIKPADRIIAALRSSTYARYLERLVNT
jgi:hypothetical protein